MRLLTIVILLIIKINFCNAQNVNNNYSKIVKEQAEIMSQLFFEQNYDSMCNYIYPEALQLMGNKEKIIETIKKGNADMKNKGTEILSITVNEPSNVIVSGNELQCTILQTIKRRDLKGVLVHESNMIAISNDNGKNWYFFYSSGKDINLLKHLFPNLSVELKIPESRGPVYIDE